MQVRLEKARHFDPNPPQPGDHTEQIAELCKFSESRDRDALVLGLDPVPVLAWHRSSNVLYLTYTGRTNTSDNTDTDVLVRTSPNGGQTWSNEIKAHSDSSKSQFHPWIGVDEQSGNASVVWYDARDNATNSQVHAYASVSRNRFQTVPQIFRLTPTPAYPASFADKLKEYIGFTYINGSLYPAWLNHRATNDLPWDIYCARIPY